MKVYIDEAGCKRRQLDIHTIKKYLVANGHSLVENPEDSDRILVSTCAFKQKEEDDSIKRLRFFRKYGREIMVFGCLPDIAKERYREFADCHKVAPKEIENLDRYFEHDTVNFADMATANTIANKHPDLVKSLKRKIQSGDLFNGELFAETAQAGASRLRELFSKPQESWFLFVCRGCHGRCSYCAIRRSVGPVKSKPLSRVVEEFRLGLGAGYRTFNILGDDPGCYGLDIGESLPGLFAALMNDLPAAATVPGIQENEVRFQLKEIHPKFLISYADRLVSRTLFRRVESMLCPVQSGSDRILKLMDREHTAGELKSVLLRTRHENPGIILDTQIIVGFPSETEADFQATLDMVKSSGYDSVVVFPYHDKEGTPASEIGAKVPAPEIRKRMREAFRYFGKNGIKAYYSCP